MANADFITTQPNIISGCFGLPRISIPKDVAESTDGILSFGIETHNGPVEVSSGGYRQVWKCRGGASALVAGGFIRPDWCPGLLGNNKTRQTVLFEAEGPQLIYGNRCGKLMAAPYIVIIRSSANKFVVEIPTTKEQGELIGQARDRGWKRDQAERLRNEQDQQLIKKRQEKEEQYSKYHHNPNLFKDESVSFVKRVFNFSMEQLSGKYEFAEHGEATIWLDEQSMQDVLCAGARLFEAIRAAKVVTRKNGHHLSIVK